MCGDPLAAQEMDGQSIAPPPIADPQLTIGGPSFLGLAEPDLQRRDEILADQPQSRSGIASLLVMLFFGAAAILAWQWGSQGHLWQVLMAHHQMTPTTEHSTTSASAVQTTSPENENRTESGPRWSQPAPPVNREEQRASSQDSGSGLPPETPAAKPHEEHTGTRPDSTRSAAGVKRSAQEDESEKLVAQAEDYLYGAGEDCGHARTNLFIAAERANPKAQSMLGTMFATGHCVGTDLRASYYWLSRAAQQEPNDVRIANDLRVVQKEMRAEQAQASPREAR